MTTANPQPADSSDRRPFRCGPWSLAAIVAGVVLLALGSCLFVAVRRAREGAIACAAHCPINQVQLGLRNYHDVYGCLPPAYVVDEQGVPAHSWRVLILPFISEHALYDAYRFDEPWNGPNNRKLADRMPETFHMPSEPDSTRMTNIVAIVGPGTAFPGARSTRWADFTDGRDNTILLAEIADSDICWLEPRDLQVDRMSFTVNDPQKPSISSSRRRGPFVVFADSINVHQPSPSLDPEMLSALTTIAGREKMYFGEIDGVGLGSLGSGPATDETIGRLDLRDLRSLWLSRSDITDKALAYLATAPALSSLHLRNTAITDDGLRKFQEGRAPHFLDLCHTEISDDGLRHLARVRNLQYPGIRINLRETRVTMAGVADFFRTMPEPEFPVDAQLDVAEGWVTHERLFLPNSPVTDAQIECFRGVTCFRQVYLSNTQITDLALAVVAGFSMLEHLDISGTSVTDAGLRQLNGLTQLNSLYLRDTEVTDEGIKALQQSLLKCVITK